MSLKYIRGGFAASQDYVCLSCRLQRLAQVRRNLRYQHTSTQPADLTPRLPDEAGPVVPLQSKEAEYGRGNTENQPNAALVKLSARKGKQLQRTLQQIFLEKRRQEGLASPAPMVAEHISSPEASKSLSKRNAKKKTIDRVVARRTEKRAKKAAPEAHIISNDRVSRKETKVSKGKAKKAKKKEKPKGSVRKAGTTTTSSEPQLTARLKSDVADLERALMSKTEDKHELKVARTVSKRSKKSKSSTVSETPKPSPSPIKVSMSNPRKVGYDLSEKASVPKPEKAVVKIKEEKSARETVRTRLRRIKAAPGKAPASRKLENVADHKSLGAALRSKDQGGLTQMAKAEIERLNAEDLKLIPLEVNRLPVPTLAYGLERVLFNPGVYHLRDPRSKVFNFDPYLQKIMPVAEFDFDALKEYITSSKDQSLKQLAQDYNKRYVGSTSSMTGALAHFHFLLSQWRSINTSMLSKTFPDPFLTFTELQRIPSAIFLRWQDGSYAIDADKQFDTANILMMLGKSMEKLLTLETADFERYRKSNPEQVTEEERNSPESFHYTTMGDFLMRSQLDAFDPRLPGTGMFDLKTRAVVSIRMEPMFPEHGVGYQIKTSQGDYESFEREYYDMIRAAFLKYSLQVRMGRMDGIFVAYHNTDRIFGFQYISIDEMDRTLHGQSDTSLGDQEFKLSLKLLNEILDKATKKYPEKSLRIHFETRDVQTPFMYIFAEPVSEEQIQEIQTQNNEKVDTFQRKLMGLEDENSESEPAQKEEDKWSDIQADVQETMARDEMSINKPSEDEDVPRAAADESVPDLKGFEVFEDGPLYRKKALDQADGDQIAVAAGSGEKEDEGEEEDGEREEEDAVEKEDGEVEETEIDSQEKTYDPASDLDKLQGEEQAQLSSVNTTGETFINTGGDGDVREVTDDGSEMKESGAGEEQVIGDEIGLVDEADQSGPSDNTELVAELDRLQQGEEGETESEIQDEELELLAQDIKEESQQTNVEMALSPDQANQHSDSSDQATSHLDTEEQQDSHSHEFDTRADQPFFEEIDQEFTPPHGSEVLAMALTIRNKVNDKYVQRPENLGPNDKWSIEYSLEEVSKPERAWSLYRACQQRRRQKLESWENKEEDNKVSDYVRRLRKLSQQGAVWREEMDRKDEGQKVAVLGQPISTLEAVSKPSEQQPEG